MSNVSQFEALIHPFFVAVCSYLKLDEKCDRLTRLNKSIKQVFKQSLDICCNDTVAIRVVQNPPEPTIVHDVLAATRAGRMNYMQYASTVELLIKTDLPEKRRRNILLSLRKAIITGTLRTLIIEEDALDLHPSITSQLFSDFSRASVTLRRLSFKLKDAVSVRRAEWFGELKQCKSLVDVMVCLSHQSNSTNDVLFQKDEYRLIMALPDCVENVVMTSRSRSDTLSPLWIAALGSRDVLPHLRRLFLMLEPVRWEVSNIHYSSFIHPVFTTIMKQTNKLRPLEIWVDGNLTKPILHPSVSCLWLK